MAHFKRNAVVEVDLNTISQNVSALQAQFNSSVKHLAVVKADAYGHGADAVAKRIAPQVDWFAVNDVEEGIALRHQNIRQPILVFEPPEAGIVNSYSRYNLTATVSDTHHFQMLPADTSYHINFDTGMGRLGFKVDQMEEVKTLREKHSYLHCTGLYSHFATADELKSTKVEEQYQLFKKIRSHFESDLIAHLCNTGGTVQCPKGHFDMVRTGIGIYGFAPGETEIPKLKPAMRWKTHFVQLKQVKKGETASYGARWSCPEDGWLGILPVGFSDGLPRRLSGQLDVRINGKSYPVVGIVTMNYCMVYVKERPPVDTMVYLLDEQCTAAHWAQKLGTIPYEIITRISKKIPRVHK